jgi:hypothetical protein
MSPRRLALRTPGRRQVTLTVRQAPSRVLFVEV